MNQIEMSQVFDLLYNQVNSNQAASLNEYEKSVFLTKAQNEIIMAYFNPKGNKFIEGFDGSEKRQYDFSTLVVNEDLTEITTSYVLNKYDPRSRVYKMPEELLLVINESITASCQSNGLHIYQVVPISYTEYQRLMQKPYQYPPKRQAWRLITDNRYYASSSQSNGSNENNAQEESQGDRGSQSIVSGTVCEIIGRFVSDTITYKMRYVKKPYPIILVNLDDEYGELTIDGYHGNASLTNESAIADSVNGGIPCYLPENIHHEIVQRAVELATAVYNPQALSAITGIGNVSSTNIGIIPRQEGK